VSRNAETIRATDLVRDTLRPAVPAVATYELDRTHYVASSPRLLMLELIMLHAPTRVEGQQAA
jgi:hypothetical protein